MMIIELARRFAWTTRTSMQWRRVAAIASSACAILLLLTGTSAIALLQRERERDLNRLPRAAEVPSPSDLFLVPIYDVHGGQQFQVVAVFPAVPGQSVLLPGLSLPLSPGRTAVSPALARLIQQDARLAARYPNPFVLQPTGVSSAGELFAYVAAPPDRPVPSGAVRISSFGQKRSEPIFPVLLPWFAGIQRDMLLGIASATLIPALVTVWVSVHAGSATRIGRWQALYTLGASRAQLRRLGAAETLWHTIPVSIPLAIGYSALAHHVDVIPIVNRAVFPGDLQPPLDLAIAAVAAVAFIGALMGWFAAGDPARVRQSVLARISLAPVLRLLPLCLALLAIMFGLVLPHAGWLMIVGFAAMIAGVPIAMPLLLRQIGLTLADSESFVALLAGRILSRESIPVARSFASVASVIVIALLASTYFAVLHEQSRNLRSTSDSRIAMLKWLSFKPEDVRALQQALAERMIRFWVEDPTTGDVTIAASCEDLQAIGFEEACLPGSSFTLSGTGEASLGRILFGGPPPFHIKLAPSIPLDRPVSALVRIFPGETSDDIRAEVGSVAVQILGPYVIVVPSDLGLRSSPLISWLRGGVFLAICTLFLSGALALLDRIIERRREWDDLIWLGASPALLRRLESLIISVSFATVAAAAWITGCLPVAISFFAGAAPVPWTSLVVIAIAVLGLWLVAVVLVRSRPLNVLDSAFPHRQSS